MIEPLSRARIALTAVRAALDVQRHLDKRRRIAACSDGEFAVWLR